MYMTQLRTSALGSTGLEITRVGLGAWALGGGGDRGWGPQDDDESIAAIHRALELGVNWIDTAAAYGFGRSERVVGRALAGMTGRPYVFTKASLLDDGTGHVRHVLKRDSILREAEGSLRRLGVDAIDLYQIHWPIPGEDIEEGWAAMAELKERGLVRHIGVSNFSAGQLRRIASIAPVETIQPPYSLIDRAAEAEILPLAQRNGTGVIVYSPMGSGLLTGTMTRERITKLPADDWRSRDSASPSRSSAGTSCWPPSCRRSPTGTTPPPVPSRSPGRCGTRPWPGPSPASAGPPRWTRSSPRRAWNSPART
jgi:aryl-alcohol dehydrogenase-like predicted oxidoreductase